MAQKGINIFKIARIIMTDIKDINKLSDLEISKRVAEIKKLDVDGPLCCESLGCMIIVKSQYGTKTIRYNPFSNEENCRLRDEFEVEINYDEGFVSLWADLIVSYDFESKKFLNKVILLAIIEAHPNESK